MKTTPKGIFCLEGNWSNNLRHPSSMGPLLDILDQRMSNKRTIRIYKSIGTQAELEEYLSKWTQKQYMTTHPVLYLGFHGDKGILHVGDGRRSGSQVDLDYLANKLQGRCKGRLIHFGSCSTLDVTKPRINRFLKKTGALAVSGFRSDVDWILSAAFDLLFISELQFGALTVSDAKAMKRRIHEAASGLERKLEFRMEVRSATWKVSR